MLNSTRCIAFQNFLNLQKLHKAYVAYQFKVNRPVYYPDRQIEMQRINEQLKSQLVTETQEKKVLPKDYYYNILGLKRHATTQQIKTAYYALAKRFHPDTNKSSHEMKRFQEISNAYHILTDEMRRLEYDQLGVVRDEQSFLRSVKSNIKPQNFNRKSDISIALQHKEVDLVNANTGEARLDLTFIEAAKGLKKNIDVRFIKKCPACNGKSAKLVNRSNPELCRKCGGVGQLTKKTSTFTSVSVCDQCQGKRFINRNNCDLCENRGLILETVKVIIPVPSGVKTGDVVSVDNPKTKERVHYRIHVLDSDYFKRIGNNIHSERYLNISEAVLGGTFKVRGIYEDLLLKLDPGCESHTKIVMKGKGIKTRETAGDHIITVKVRIPKQLSMKQRQIILALSKTEEPIFERTVI